MPHAVQGTADLPGARLPGSAGILPAVNCAQFIDLKSFCPLVQHGYRGSYLLSLRSRKGSGRASATMRPSGPTRRNKDSVVPWTRLTQEWRRREESRNLLPLRRSRTAISLNPHGATESLHAARGHGDGACACRQVRGRGHLRAHRSLREARSHGVLTRLPRLLMRGHRSDPTPSLLVMAVRRSTQGRPVRRSASAVAQRPCLPRVSIAAKKRPSRSTRSLKTVYPSRPRW